MRKYIFFIFTLVLPMLSLAHEANRSFFKIEQKEDTVNIIAEFPWTIRNALLDFAPKLKNSKSKEAFDRAFFQYIKSSLILTDSNGNQLDLIQVKPIKSGGHSHQNDFLISFKGKNFYKVLNRISFNIDASQINHHTIIGNNETKVFYTTTEHYYFEISNQDNATYEFLWLLIIIPISMGLFFKKKNLFNNNAATFLIFIGLFISCSTEEITEAELENNKGTSSSNQPNILFIIADDMGLDATPGYDIGAIKPSMPTLEKLFSSGIKFNNLWSNPTCSPTRASILTGKFGFRNGVTKVGDKLSTSETSLQTYLQNNGASAYASAVIGKWHLSKNANHPNVMGLDYYAGSLGGELRSYFDWDLTINGQTTVATEYATTKLTNLAIDWIDNQTQLWFLWLAYTAPHAPFHLPPNELHSQGDLPIDQASIDTNPLSYYLAMIEALDTEMGRLIEGMSQEERENTIIIFIGDNGTPNSVAQEYNMRRVKGTVYKGGINVPMIISGKNVTRINTTDDTLINTTDLFATIANIAGVDVSEVNDSKSFANLLGNKTLDFRNIIFSEIGKDAGTSNYAIRNSTHKYILFENGNEALFDLNVSPFENPNLLNSSLSDDNSLMKESLKNKLSELID